MYSFQQVLLILLTFFNLSTLIQTDPPPIKRFIGEIQGTGAQSPYLNQVVRFEGIVTALYQYENSNGRIYYTLFVQEPSDQTDGNPESSDGIPIFLGSKRPQLEIGDWVDVTGTVTEYYGLTELDDANLSIQFISSNHPLPEAKELLIPYSNLEKWEGMRLSIPMATVVAPTHAACGLAVSEKEIPYLISETKEVTTTISLLFPRNKECDDWPQAKVGDHLSQIVGPLTYQFDQFKIILQERPTHTISSLTQLTPEQKSSGQIELVSLNLHNLFDTKSDTGESFEPVLTDDDLNIRLTKLADGIGTSMNCPTMIAVQEVENRTLLEQLVVQIEPKCNFIYQITHEESNDARGIDLALLSDPSVSIINSRLIQGCTTVKTGLGSDSQSCPNNNRLFSRPPFSITTNINGRSLDLLLLHFKSKRGGSKETADWRIAQASFIISLIQNQQNRFILLGDLNDLPQSAPLQIFYQAELQQPPSKEQNPIYTYIFDGTHQQIDYILLPTEMINESKPELHSYHLNAQYPASWQLRLDPPYHLFRFSDHDPLAIRFEWPPTLPPTQPTPHLQLQPTPSPTAQLDIEPAPSATVTTPITRSSPATETAPPSETAQPNASPNLLSAISCLISLIIISILGRISWYT